MSTWEWHAYSFTTGAYVGPVPMSKWAHEDRPFTTAGSFQATLEPPRGGSLDEARDRARFVLGAVAQTQSVIVALRTDDFGLTRAEFAGWVPPGGERRPEIAGKGLLGYFDHRFIEEAVTYTDVEQTAILADLIATTPGGPALDLTTRVTATGVLRSQTWTPSQNKRVSEALRDIAGRLDGFEFDIAAEIDAGQLVRRLRTWYPRRGGTTVPVFEYGRNMISEPTVEGSETYANQILALGKVTNPGSETEERVRLTSIKASGATPIIAKSIDREDITDQGELDAAAEGALRQAGVRDDAEITFEVDPNHPSALYGSWGIGDDCRVMFPVGRPWWPDGLDEVRRVLGHKWTVEGGRERLWIITGLRWPA